MIIGHDHMSYSITKGRGPGKCGQRMLLQRAS